MSSKIDERIVAMKFNNDQFQKGVADTNRSLETLKKGLNLSDASKNLQNLGSVAKNFSLAALSEGVQSITSKLNGMAVVGITALTNIANKAIDTGLSLVKSLTIDPVKAGLAEYELKMGSIQTILANTSRYGTSLQQVTSSLDELNTYADKTIYNFGDMTKNIGLFTNAGIRIEDATSMIKGFSNEAAASGTSSQGAAGAAYQLSQALSAGTIRLMDWRSLTNVGMGNKNMQNGLIEIADAMGTLSANSISAADVQKDFNGTLEKNWLSADVMSSYLKIMAGDMNEAEQAALGLSDAQIAAFKKQANTAEEAATKVRTWTQLVGTMQEGVGSGWAQTFDILIGDFDQATEMWTAVNDALGPIIAASGDARNQLLEAWSGLGGRDSAIMAVGNAFKAVMALVKPVTDAFREIFPPMTAQQLLDITKAVENFTKSLMPSEKQIQLIKSTAKGLFAVLDIGWMVIQQVVGVLGRLFGAASEGAGGLLEMTGAAGDWLVKVRDAIKNGNGLGAIFKWIGDQLVRPINLLNKFGSATLDFIDLGSWAELWDKVGNAIKKVGEFLAPVGQWIGEAFGNIKAVVSEFFKGLDFNVLIGLLNVGALTGVGLMIKKAIDVIKEGLTFGDGDGIVQTIKDVFGSVTDTFGAMQEKLKAEALTKIAIAIGILTAAVIALSFVDTGKLFISLGAMAVMFAMLAGMMVVLDTVVSSEGFKKLPFLAASMVGMATAMLILSAAISIMASLSWAELAKGLTGMAVGLGLFVGAMALMDRIYGKMGPMAAAMVLMSTAMVILAAALKIMGSMTWDEIGRGMTVFAGSLALMVASMKAMQGGLAGAAAMIIVAGAMVILSGALKVMGSMQWDEIGRGLTVLAGSLAILVVALMFLQGSLLGAAAMIVVAGAMVILAGALKIFATFSWEEIGKAMVMLAGSLAILAGAMALMGIPLVLLGAVGLLAAAGAMMVLAPALVLLGTMSWEAIGAGLTMLAASLAILAVGGLLLIPAIPGLMGLAAAAGLIGIAALAAGAGMAMFAGGLATLAGVATVSSEAIKTAILTIVSTIPEAMAAFAQGIIDFALVIAGGGAQFTAAMTTLLMSLITAIQTVGPAIINTLFVLIMALATKLEENVPVLVQKGGNLIIGVLNGIAAKVPGIAKAGTDLIIALINAVANEVPRLAEAGAQAIVKLVNGVASAVERNSAAIGAAGGRLASAIIRGMVNGIGNGIGEIVSAARNMAANALSAAKNLLGIHSPSREFMKIGEFVNQGFVKGLTGSSGEVQATYENIQKLLSNAVAGAKKDIASYQASIKKLTDSRNEDNRAIARANHELAEARREGKDTYSIQERIRKLTKARDADTAAIVSNQRALAESQAELKKAEESSRTLTKNYKDSGPTLKKLANQYDALGVKIKAAQKALDEAKKDQKDYGDDLKGQYGKLTQFDKNTGLAVYKVELKKQIADTKELTSKLGELRGLGLNEKLYKELLDKGIESLPFIDQILAGGGASVDELNGLANQLDKAAGRLGDQATKDMYTAGVQAAQGLLKGLQDEQVAIDNQMNVIAESMLKAVKKTLGIKSPSREFAKLGRYSTEGLVKGLGGTNAAVGKAASNVGTTALKAMSKSLDKLPMDFSGISDSAPVIRPVLDLTNVTNGLRNLESMPAKAPKLQVDASYQSALKASEMNNEQLAFKNMMAIAPNKEPDVTFIQNNNSPKSLSHAEIYRQTNNQLSVAKKELTT